GRTFTDPALILPGWTLRLPTRPGPLPAPAVVTPAPAPASSPPVHQEPAPAPAGAPTTAPDAVASPAAPAPARPVRSPGASPAPRGPPACEPARPPTPGHGVRVPPALLIAPSVASGALALALLARRRRRGARPLDSPEPRRADPPIIGGIRAGGTVASIDPLA